MQFLLFQIVDDVAVGKGPVLFALQLLIKFGVLATKCGQMIIIHTILLQCETRRSEPKSKTRILT